MLDWDLTELANDLKFLGRVPDSIRRPCVPCKELLDPGSLPGDLPPPSKLVLLREAKDSLRRNVGFPREGEDERDCRAELCLGELYDPDC